VSEHLQRVIEAIDRRADEIVEFAAELVRQPSVNPDLEPNEDAERPAQEWLRDQLEATGGYEIDFYELAPNRPNVVATRKGTGGGRSLIWAGHIDVVGSLRSLFGRGYRRQDLWARRLRHEGRDRGVRDGREDSEG
jgi:hypothetical protein